MISYLIDKQGIRLFMCAIYRVVPYLVNLRISCFLPRTIRLLLALQRGTTYAASYARIVAALIILAILTLELFIVIQTIKKGAALIPPRIITCRNEVSVAWLAFCLGALNADAYPLPPNLISGGPRRRRHGIGHSYASTYPEAVLFSPRQGRMS